MTRTFTRRLLLAVGLLLGVAAYGPKPAQAYTQGPMNWSRDQTTSRYPRHAGNHHLSISNCGSQVQTMELRVDIVNKQDVGYGNRSYTCGRTVRTQNSGYDTYGSAYRGHFLQVRTWFYGTLNDRA